jgi:hypothetical protein
LNLPCYPLPYFRLHTLLLEALQKQILQIHFKAQSSQLISVLKRHPQSMIATLKNCFKYCLLDDMIHNFDSCVHYMLVSTLV